MQFIWEEIQEIQENRKMGQGRQPIKGLSKTFTTEPLGSVHWDLLKTTPHSCPSAAGG
jgi:hypothetical protein